MFDLFGSEMPLAARFFIAFLVVLALIGVTAWLVRRFGGGKLGNAAARGRQPRLAVIDAATVDARRRLVLIRRDNIEHLLMIGGPTDLVVEPNIVRAIGSREVTREPGRLEPVVGRPPAAEGTSWPLQPSSEPVPSAPPPRSYRSPATEEPWHAPEPGARPRPADSLTGLAHELSSRLTPPEQPAPRPDPAPRASVAPPPLPSEPPPSPQNDHNLAEMAMQLEAALRRPAAPVTDPLAVQAKPAAKRVEPKIEPKVEPKFEAPKFDAPKVEPKLEVKPEVKPDLTSEFKFEPNFDSVFDTPKAEVKPEPKYEPKYEPKHEPKYEPKLEPKFEPKAAAAPEPTPGKKLYDSLEEEMASLLGRPSGKT